MLRGVLGALLTFVVLVVLLGLLGNVGGVELGLTLLVAAVVGWLVARRDSRQAQTADPLS